MKRLTLILFLISTISAWSQTDSTLLWQKANFDSTANFYNVVQMQNNYFKLHPDTLEGEEGNRSEFYRWAQFWASRVDRSDSQTYSIHSALKKYQAISANISSYFTAPTNSSLDWYYLGPKNLSTQNYGVVPCVKIDPNDPTLQTYYAGTGTSGLWKTTDGGQSWKNITGPYLSYGLGILDIAINPTNPDVIYIATCFGGLGRAYYYGKGIMQTTDGGQTWQTPSNMNFPAWWQIPITKFVMDPNNPNRIVAFGKNYIYRTLDGVNWDSLTVVPQGINGFCNSGGVTWLNPKTVRDAVFMPGNTNSVIVGTDFVSTSTAELWQIDNIFSNNINSGDFHELSGQLSNTYDRFSIDIKKGTTGNPDIVYFGGLTSTNFSIFYIDPNTSMITPYCTVTNNINMSASQCEFKMSQLTNNTFILCGYFFNYY